MSASVIIASFLGGVIPAVLWLEFWLREANHREPRRLIVGAFLLGMVSIFVAGFLEQATGLFLIEYTTMSFFAWAAIEEVLKFSSAYVVGLRTRFCDEAIDPAIYLITAALGFSAGENILFLFDPLSVGDIAKGLMTITFRSVGATLVHVVASGAVGIAIGFTFYKSTKVKRVAVFIGLLVATLLHTVFNRLIIEGQNHALLIFSGVWIGLIAVIVILEKIKSSKKLSLIKIPKNLSH
ncbi:MAG TPA: PrsW family glutamic-type intramembrane protease [Candidatus Paceibacterota bacterium]